MSSVYSLRSRPCLPAPPPSFLLAVVPQRWPRLLEGDAVLAGLGRGGLRGLGQRRQRRPPGRLGRRLGTPSVEACDKTLGLAEGSRSPLIYQESVQNLG